MLLVLNYFQGKQSYAWCQTWLIRLISFANTVITVTICCICRQVSILIILLLWLVWLVLLLPVAMVSASQIKDWFLRLIALVSFLMQYGSDQGLLISKNLPVMHSITTSKTLSRLCITDSTLVINVAWNTFGVL